MPRNSLACEEVNIWRENSIRGEDCFDFSVSAKYEFMVLVISWIFVFFIVKFMRQFLLHRYLDG